jgi:molybdenum cofactor synthesis domain-containing protein
MDLNGAAGVSIIAIGDELLAGHTLDTNTNWLAQRLRVLGHLLRRVHVVSDAEAEIVRWLRLEMEAESRFIFVCGGLGPTPDDRTLAALGAALEVPLELHPEAARHIQERLNWLHEIGRIPSAEMSEANRRMGEVPQGSVVLHNSTGMAPGLAIEFQPGRQVFVLPGVPREFKAIFDEEIAPRFLDGGVVMTTEEVHFDGVAEALFWDLLTRIGREYPEVSVGSYPQPDRGHLIIRLSGVDVERVNAATDLVRTEAPARPRQG